MMRRAWPELRFGDGVWVDADARPGASQLRRALMDLLADSYPGEDHRLLVAIRCTCELQERVDETLKLLVAESRANGVTWQTIGASVGTGRTAAQKRFGGGQEAAIDEVRAQHRRRLAVAREIMENIDLEDEARVDLYERFLERSGYVTGNQLLEEDH